MLSFPWIWAQIPFFSSEQNARVVWRGNQDPKGKHVTCFFFQTPQHDVESHTKDTNSGSSPRGSAALLIFGFHSKFTARQN